MLVLLMIASLPIQGSSPCPTPVEVTQALDELRTPTAPSDAFVEVIRTRYTIEVGLHDEAGGLMAARSVAIGSHSCDELAFEIAAIVRLWETPLRAHPLRASGRVPALVETVEDGEVGRGLRVFASLLGASFAMLIPAGIMSAAGNGSRGVVLLMSTVGLGPPVIAAMALAGHAAAKGRGNYGYAILGSLLGCATALAVLFAPAGVHDPTEPELIVPAAVLAVASPALFLELSDARERSQLQVAAAPLPGGAVLSVASSW